MASSASSTSERSTRARRRISADGGGLVGPEGLVGDAPPAQPAAAAAISARRSTRIGAATRQASRRSRARPRSMSAAARGCCANRSRGWARRSPGSTPRRRISRSARGACRSGGLAIDYRAGGDRGSVDRALRPRHLPGGDRACQPTPPPSCAGWRARWPTGGLLILSTPNRTPLSRLAMITIARRDRADPARARTTGTSS